MTIDTAPTIDRTEEATGALADRVFASVLGALDILTIHIGDQLGSTTCCTVAARWTSPRSPRRAARTRATPASGSSNRPSPA